MGKPEPHPGRRGSFCISVTAPISKKSKTSSVRSLRASDSSDPAISRGIVEECDWTEEWKKSYTSFPDRAILLRDPELGRFAHVRTIGCPSASIPGRLSGQELTKRRSSPWRPWNDGLSRPRSFSISEQVRAFWQSHRGLLGAREVFGCDIDPVAERSLARISTAMPKTKYGLSADLRGCDTDGFSPSRPVQYDSGSDIESI